MSNIDILVTGGHGFVGRAIVSALREQQPSWRVSIIDIQKPVNDSTDLLEEIHFLETDVTSIAEVQEAFRILKPTVVIHSAAVVPTLAERYTRASERVVKNVNINGTRNVLKAAVEAGVEAFIYTSSCCAVIDDLKGYYANIDERWPVSRRSTVYGESKVEAEELVIAANGASMTTCVLRPSVIFGEGDTALVPPIHACIAKGETPYQLGEGINLWDTVYVGNVADAHVLAAENLLSSNTAAGHVFFIQNNEPITFREFCLAVWKEFGHVPPFRLEIPESLAIVIGFVAEWSTWLSGMPTTISRKSIMDACAMRYATGDKARTILGYIPRVGLEEGLGRSCAEYSRRLKTRSDQATSRAT